LGETAPAWNSSSNRPYSFSYRIGLIGSETTFSDNICSNLNALQLSPTLLRLRATIHAQTIHGPLRCSQHHREQLTTN
jgi:hypothetical protein